MESRLEIASNNKQDLSLTQKYLESIGWIVVEKQVIIHGDRFPGSYIVFSMRKDEER